MATSLTLQNDTSLQQGYIKVNGTTAATITTSGIQANLTGNVTGSLTSGGSLTLGTEQTASGTSVDFTGIPSWAKRITVMFNGVSLNGTDSFLVQIGSGSLTLSGYNSCSASLITASGASVAASSLGYIIYNNAGSDIISGHMVITLMGSNTYVSSHTLAGDSTRDVVWLGGGNVALSSALDCLRITTVNGTLTFDAGTINISYEG